MATKLFYKISLLLNAVLSILFLAVGVIGLYQEKRFEPAAILIISFIFIIYSLFLLFDMLCFRLHRANYTNQPAAIWITGNGKWIFVLCCLMAALVSVVALLAFVTDLERISRNNRADFIFYCIFLLLMLLSAASIIINGVSFFSAVRQNKLIVNTVINAIGENN